MDLIVSVPEFTFLLYQALEYDLAHQIYFLMLKRNWITIRSHV